MAGRLVLHLQTGPPAADADPASSTRLRGGAGGINPNAMPPPRPTNARMRIAAITSWTTTLRSLPLPSPSDPKLFHHCLSFCSNTSSQAVYCCRSRRLLKNRIVIADIAAENRCRYEIRTSCKFSNPSSAYRNADFRLHQLVWYLLHRGSVSASTHNISTGRSADTY